MPSGAKEGTSPDMIHKYVLNKGGPSVRNQLVGLLVGLL